MVSLQDHEGYGWALCSWATGWMVQSRPFRLLMWLQTLNGLPRVRGKLEMVWGAWGASLFLNVIITSCQKQHRVLGLTTLSQRTSCYCHFTPSFHIVLGHCMKQGSLRLFSFLWFLTTVHREVYGTAELAQEGQVEFLLKGTICCVSAAFTGTLCMFLLN